MRFPRFKLTLRAMMVLVALVAATLVGGKYALRSRHLSRAYALKAADLAAQERAAATPIPTSHSGPFADLERKLIGSEEARESQRRLVAYYAGLRHKYETAARFPWLSVETDSPPPDEGGSFSLRSEPESDFLGTWELVSLHRGTRSEPTQGRRLVIDGGLWREERPEEGLEILWVVRRSSRNDPPIISGKAEVSRAGGAARMKFRGVYRLSGETLRIAIMASRNIPRDFRPVQGVDIEVWRRVE